MNNDSTRLLCVYEPEMSCVLEDLEVGNLVKCVIDDHEDEDGDRKMEMVRKYGKRFCEHFSEREWDW